VGGRMERCEPRKRKNVQPPERAARKTNSAIDRVTNSTTCAEQESRREWNREARVEMRTWSQSSLSPFPARPTPSRKPPVNREYLRPEHPEEGARRRQEPWKRRSGRVTEAHNPTKTSDSAIAAPGIAAAGEKAADQILPFFFKTT
jgi:hypothetical protein